MQRSRNTPKKQAGDSHEKIPSRREILYAILLLAGLGTSAVYGAYLCRSSAAIHYLSAEPPGEWVVFPSPIVLVGQGAVKQTAVFRRSIFLPTPPASVSLRIRACDEFSVRIDGRDVNWARPPNTNWKDITELDIREYLKSGENGITVTVSNSNGPPALWLTLNAGDVQLASDRQWQVSLNGSGFAPAAPALEPPARERTKAVPRGEATLESLFSCRWILLLYAGISSLIVAAAVGYKKLAARFRLSIPWYAAALAVIAAFWVFLFCNNLVSLRSHIGFDYPKHVEYIDFIRQHGALPAANQGWEMYQPPLYYLLSAAVLKCCGLSAWDDASVVALRLFSLILGLGQIALVFACLRRVFPQRPGPQLAGLLLAAFTSVQLYTFHFVTNDTLLSVFGAAAIYLALRMLQEREYGLRLSFALGLCLGAALLTKITAVLLVAVVGGALAAQLVVEQRYAPRVWFRAVGVPLLTCFSVGGWHYARLWAQFGTPFFTNMSPQSPFAHWAHPGYSHAGYFLGLGRSLIAPFFSVFNSFGDGAYSTLWGDGTWAGAAAKPARLPWNYELMAAGYLLALMPTAVVLVGTSVAIVRLFRQPRAEWLMLTGLASSLMVASVYFYLLHPFYSAVKSSYGLIGMVAFCALGGLGWDALAAGRRVVSIVLAVLLGTWALASCGSFWVVHSSASTLAWRAETICSRGSELLGRGRIDEAIAEYSKALELDPNHAKAHNNLGVSFARRGKIDDAIGQYRQALEIEPNYMEAHMSLALALAGRRQIDDAIPHFQKAADLAPENIQVRLGIGDALAAHGKLNEAKVYYQKALEMAVATRQDDLANSIRVRMRRTQTAVP
jgi:tetratricopeptide (TPR) repeat protein